MKRVQLLGFVALLAVTACGSPGRPVGLPPPEYDPPRVEPWSPPATAAAAPAAEPEISTAPPAGPENEGGSGATLPPGTP